MFEQALELFSGIYEHKGKLYKLEQVQQVHHTGELWVAYTPLYHNPAHTGPPTHTRPLAEFREQFSYYGLVFLD